MAVRTQIRVRGIVQGVGFRPFVFLQATERSLKGRVFNSSAGVLIDLEGEAERIEEFITELRTHPPPLARIESLERSDAWAVESYDDFQVSDSQSAQGEFTPMAPDLATCVDCLHEVEDPANRRYGYPFITCTHCGPRFTIITSAPYDRARTTMRDFALCADCRAEYEDPANRRFHAETVACWRCGPQVVLTSTVQAPGSSPAAANEAAIDEARRLLAAGNILAIKGIGGYHLACDALNSQAVERLRQRKQREAKPFALMGDGLRLIRRFCIVSPAEERLLLSRRRPIVLLEKKPGCVIPAAVAPGVSTLGFMLAYTPLHHLVLKGLDRPLVMTSGNVSDEPIAHVDDDARSRLGRIADYLLSHNRRIQMRADDSVVAIRAGRQSILRRSRGFAPEPVKIAGGCASEVLACGGQLKNTFCLTRDGYAFLSHHIGDLENYETYRAFVNGIEHYKKLFGLRASVVAYDLHPLYLSTRYAAEVDSDIKIAVQHHHAHIASCMAEHGLQGPVIGVAMDGLGYGEDGAMWGGEFLVADLARYHRAAHFRYTPLAGGNRAIREPWRAACAYLEDAFGLAAHELDLPWWQPAHSRTLKTVAQMARGGINTVLTSSCGRLFDAVASLLGLRHEVQYEAQAAIELETVALRNVGNVYPFDINTRTTPQEIDFRETIRTIVRDRTKGASAGVISARFHNTISEVIVAVCERLRASEGIAAVCLSGGVFQNVYLLKRVLTLLGQRRFTVYFPLRLPPNDGGISLGQAVIAGARLK